MVSAESDGSVTTVEDRWHLSQVTASMSVYERALLDVMFDRVPIGIAVFDQERCLRRCNATWADFIDRHTPTPISPVVEGQGLYALVPDAESRLGPVIERVLTGEVVQLDGCHAEKGGELSYWDEVLVPLLRDQEIVGFVDITIDATERERACRLLEQRDAERGLELRRRREVAEALRDILTVLNSDLPHGKIMEYVVAKASQLLGSGGGVIYHLDPESESVSIEASYALPRSIRALEPFPLRRDRIADALLGREPLVVSDLASYLATEVPSAAGAAQDVRVRQWLDTISRHYQAYLGVPLVIKDRLYGTLEVYYREPKEFSPDDIELAVAVGDQVALAVENARLRTQASQGAVVAERERLARELHDSVTQSLYSLTLLAEASQRLAGVGDLEPVREYTARLGEIAQQALREMRLLVYQLRPLVLRREGLVGALQQRLDAVEKRAGVHARLFVEGWRELPADVEDGLYGIAQEALNNALKHAAPKTVMVRLQADAQTVSLEVQDDGRGFEPTGVSDKGGMGLANMRQRAERLGGSFSVISAPGGGTTVRVELESL